MTKLKLNLAQGAGEILTREELKKVLGGNGYYCTRSKGTETVSNFFTKTSSDVVNSWVYAWEGLGWNAYCTNMPQYILGSGSGSGSVLV